MEIEKFRNERIFALSDMNASLIRGAPECGWEWVLMGEMSLMRLAKSLGNMC